MAFNLKGFLFEGNEEPEKSPVPAKPAVVAAPPVQYQPAPSMTQTFAPTFAAGLIDESDPYVSKLRQKLQGNTPPVIMQFNATLKSLSKFILDERSRYLAAFETAQGNGVVLPQLESGYAALLQSLETEKSGLESGLSQSRQNEITAPQQKIEAIGQQIKSLEEQIASLRQQQASINESVAQKEAQLQGLEQGFLRAYTYVKSEIESALSNIKKNLGATTNG